MPAHRFATQADLSPLWELRTRAVRASCAAHYPPAVIDAAFVEPVHQGRGIALRLLRQELYPHRSGIGIASVFMEKRLSQPS